MWIGPPRTLNSRLPKPRSQRDSIGLRDALARPLFWILGANIAALAGLMVGRQPHSFQGRAHVESCLKRVVAEAATRPRFVPSAAQNPLAPIPKNGACESELTRTVGGSVWESNPPNAF